MFKYTIEQCDVEDKDRLQRFREFKTKCIEWLDGEDAHAIWKQVFALFWHDSVFRMVNECRKLNETSLDSSTGFNGPMIGLFDAGFASVQAMAIRRIVQTQPSKPEWKVISLKALVDDIENNLELFTRENYVSGDGLPYDWNEKWQCWHETPHNKSGSLPNEGPEAWYKSKLFHDEFDKLSGTKPETRTRSDVIRKELLANAISKLAVCDDVVIYTHKFIAHAADPSNRHELIDEQEKLTLKKLEDCCKAIYLVSDFVSRIIGKGTCISPIPVPQYDHLKYLDRRLVPPARLDKIREKWHERNNEVEEWENDLWPPSQQT